MSRMIISYRVFPNSIEATEYSKRTAGMTKALRVLAVMLTAACFAAFRDVLHSSETDTTITEKWIVIISMYLVLGFDFYAFLCRIFQINYGINVILVNEEYRRVTVYTEEKPSDQFIKECQEERDEEIERLKRKYKTRIVKSAIVYIFVVMIVTFILLA